MKSYKSLFSFVNQIKWRAVLDAFASGGVSLFSDPKVPINPDLLKWEMQTAGHFYVVGLTLSEVLKVITDLGVDPAMVKFSSTGYIMRVK